MIPADAIRVPYDPRAARRSLFQALLQARRRHGGATPALVDVDDRVLTYDTLVKGTLALGHALKRGTKAEECIGVMLPTGAAAAIAIFGISAYGRVPTMINFTSGAANILSALKTAQVTRIVTARRFIGIARLEELVSELARVAEIVYLEDVRAGLTLLNKAAAAAGLVAPRLVAARPDPDSTAVILFTS